MINQIEEETGSLPENLPRGVAPEVAAANPDVQAIIAPRLTMLMEIANSFLVTIIDSLDDVPYGIRWICKQIRSLTRVRLSVTIVNWPSSQAGTVEKIPRGYRHCDLLAYRRILLPSLHQPSNRHPSGVHVGRRRSGETPETDVDSGKCRRSAIRARLISIADRKNASKLGKQAFLFEGGVYGNAQSICGKQQGTNQPILEQSL